MKQIQRIAILAILFTMTFVSVSKAQKVFSCQYKSDAKVKVYVAQYKSDADLVVYKCDYKSDADIVIFFSTYKSDAGWKNNSKKSLFY